MQLTNYTCTWQLLAAAIVNLCHVRVIHEDKLMMVWNLNV